MWIAIQTKHVKVTARTRRVIENYVRKMFSRQRREIANCIVTITSVRSGGNEALMCHVRLWSARLGTVSVRHVGDTLRSAVQPAAARARAAVRRRLHKRLARSRRLGDRRLAMRPTAAA